MVTPYITFDGNCRQALEFYAEVFQTSVTSSYPYGDYIPEGTKTPPEELKNWVMHAEMQLCGTPFWFADEAAEPVSKGNLIRLTAQVPDSAEARRIFSMLSEGARITLPPTETFYSAFHAGLTDKFGVCWNIVALEPPKRDA